MFKLDFKKAEGPEIKLETSFGSLKKQESSRKTSTSALLTTPKPLTLWITANAKVFNCVDHNKLWKILKEMGIPDHFTCFLRSLYAGQEAIVRNRHDNRLVPNWKRSTSRLYIVFLLIYFICTVHHAKCQAR